MCHFTELVAAALGSRFFGLRLGRRLADTLDLDRAVGDEGGNRPCGGEPGGDERARHPNRQRELDDRIRSLLDDDASDVAFMDEPRDFLQERTPLGAERLRPRSLCCLSQREPPLVHRPARAGS